MVDPLLLHFSQPWSLQILEETLAATMTK